MRDRYRVNDRWCGRRGHPFFATVFEPLARVILCASLTKTLYSDHLLGAARLTFLFVEFLPQGLTPARKIKTAKQRGGVTHAGGPERLQKNKNDPKVTPLPTLALVQRVNVSTTATHIIGSLSQGDARYDRGAPSTFRLKSFFSE